MGPVADSVTQTRLMSIISGTGIYISYKESLSHAPLAHAYTHTHTRITRLGARLGTLLTHKNTQAITRLHNYT